MFGRVRTGSDCDHESLSRLSGAKAEVYSSLLHSDLRFRLAGLGRFRSSADCLRFCIERTYLYLGPAQGSIASSYRTPPCRLTDGEFRICSDQWPLRLRPVGVVRRLPPHVGPAGQAPRPKDDRISSLFEIHTVYNQQNIISRRDGRVV
jgi:hypothetical protein